MHVIDHAPDWEDVGSLVTADDWAADKGVSKMASYLYKNKCGHCFLYSPHGGSENVSRVLINRE